MRRRYICLAQTNRDVFEYCTSSWVYFFLHRIYCLKFLPRYSIITDFDKHICAFVIESNTLLPSTYTPTSTGVCVENQKCLLLRSPEWTQQMVWADTHTAAPAHTHITNDCPSGIVEFLNTIAPSSPLPICKVSGNFCTTPCFFPGNREKKDTTSLKPHIPHTPTQMRHAAHYLNM